MSFRSVLLRVILSVALVFNGAATAVASVQMNHGTDMAEMAGQSAPVAAPVAEPPCHQHQQMASEAPTEQPAAAPDTAPSGSKPISPDCCKSGACSCACVHHAQAAIPVVVFNAVVIEHADSVRAMPLGYAPPALPHLLRPPIG